MVRKHKLTIQILLGLFSLMLFCAILINSNSVSAQASAGNSGLITTRNDFINALNKAENGDTILVGDIDFNLNSTGAVNTLERIIIDKSVTIKSGKTDEKAVFIGASFILNGTKIGGESSSFAFEGITFDEGLDTSTLTDEDWQLAYDSMGEELSPYPLKNQYAIQCKGNATASFANCEFKNYMHTYGPAVRAFYADYTLTPSLEAEHGDNVPYKLELNLKGCSFSSNASLYGGGAVYVEGIDKNVTLNVTDCSFNDNKSGFVQNAVGGGAVFVKNAVATFEGCVFKDNEANYYYGGERFWSDQLSGGAIGCDDGSKLTVRNCQIISNKAGVGGGIGVSISNADIEDCYITENKAIPETEDKRSALGLASNQGLGGAIYLNGATSVTIGNTEIRHNYAENAMSAIFTDYNPSLDYSTRSVDLLFCTIAENTCKTAMSDCTGYGEDKWLWFSWYPDFFDISYLNYYGNLVVDELYETHNPKNEQPTEENGYNFFGSAAPAQWYNEEGHLVHAPTVSTDFIKEKLGDRNYYGTFTVGANNHEVTFRFFMDGVCKETVVLPSGVNPTRPAFEKVGYTLTAWTLTEDFDYQADRHFIIGNKTESVDFHAVFTPNTYTVTYHFGEATQEVEQTYDTQLVPPTPQERSGYRFIGWFTQENGKGDKLVVGSNYETASDITFYAYYEKEFPEFYVIISVVGTVLIISVAVLAGFVIYRRKHPHMAPATDSGVPLPEEKVLPDTSMLSQREKEVLELLLQGKQRNEIATTLYISENTVKKNISSIYTKLNVSSRNELFALFK